MLERDLVEDIQNRVRKNIDLQRELSDQAVKDVITETVFAKSKEKYLSVTVKQELINYVFNAMRRLDIIQPLLDDPEITEIMVNGPENIFVEKAGCLQKLPLAFSSKEKLEDVIQTIVAKVNRTVNEASPLVDARLKDGSRVNVVLEPIALNGPILTIRKFPEKPLTMEDLIAGGTISEEAAAFLARLVRAKYNLFISGGTSSGKTTFLNVLSNFIPVNERIVTLEDSAELQISGVKNIVRLETRNANPEGKGEISMCDLIKSSLRMRPDRIIVGEVRGREALDMLQAMNTGHDGSLSTGHANSSLDMLSRLETMVLMAAPFPLAAIRRQIAAALDVIIHLSRLRDQKRCVMEISEVKGLRDGEIELNPLFVLCENKGSGLERTKEPFINQGKLLLAEGNEA